MEQEVKTEDSSQQAETEVKTYSDEQFKGLLADKQAEVKKRQEAEKQIADLTQQVEQLTARPSRENEEISETDRPLTVGQFQKLMDEQAQTREENAYRKLQADSKRKAMAEKTAETCGEGLDYASVIAAGQANLTEGDLLAIKASKDPAAEKYRRCVMLTPELNAKAETVRTNRLLENIKLTGKVPAAGGTGQTAVTPDDVSRMSAEELDRLAESIG